MPKDAKQKRFLDWGTIQKASKVLKNKRRKSERTSSYKCDLVFEKQNSRRDENQKEVFINFIWSLLGFLGFNSSS